MFLRRIPYQSVRRRRIRHWLLLLMRLAALALIVAGVRAAVLPRRRRSRRGRGGAREVVILLDRSYSMGYGDRWPRALAAARGAVDGLNAVDRASLVFFDRRAEVALRSTVGQGPAAVGAGRRAALGRGDHYGPALKLAGSLLARVDAAAPRSDPDHRFPARRLAAAPTACGCRTAPS